MQLKKTDLFTFIHKSLRNMIYNAGSKLLLTDFANASETEEMINSLKVCLDLLHEHAVHEDNIIFPEIANNEPEMIKMLNDEHHEIEQKLNLLQTHLDKILVTDDSNIRLELGNQLNNLFNDFSASYLAHMNHEETTVLDASFKYLTDKELVAIRTRIQTQIPPERYKIWLNWMLTSLNNQELIGLLDGMKASAPPHIFENVIGVAQSIINKQRFETVKTRIGL